jgi:hypothetical protein
MTRMPSTAIYPDFNEPLRQAMETETRLFFQAFLGGSDPIGKMLDANFTFVNAPLAKHYGISSVAGTGFQRVSLDGTHRAGLLTLGSVLVATSAPTRSSIPMRGKFILSELLCTPPSDPPANLPVLPPTPSAGRTIRDELVAATSVRADCVSCHAQLNPLGFGLEHFDGSGAWRPTDNGVAIDATGKLPDGSSFDGNLDEAQVIKRNPALDRCVAQMLLTYALGRQLEVSDQPFLKAIVAATTPKGDRLEDLIQRIAIDPTFTSRGG